MQTHKVQSGDTLSAIARHYQTTIDELQSVNPQITDIDYIQVGWELKIPANDAAEAANDAQTLPPPRSAGNESSGQSSCTECSGEYAEVIHVTGADDGKWCVALPDEAADDLYQEIAEIDALMAEFNQAQNSTADDQDDEPGPKRRWMQKATEMGVIDPAPDEHDDKDANKASRISSEIAAIDEQIEWYNDFDSDHLWAAVSDSEEMREDIMTTAKERRLEMLRQERRDLVARLEKGTASSGVKGNGVASENFLSSHSNSREAGFGAARSIRQETGIVEVMVFSRPGRWYYIRREAYQRLVTTYSSVRYVRKTRAISNTLRDPSGTAKALIGQIRDGIAADAAKSPIGNIEVKFAEASDEHYLLGEEHSKLTWNSGGDDESPTENNFQVSAEAHLMRFAMQASAGVNAFDLSTGEIDIGTKASASMALLEAEAKLAEIFVPDEAGWDCRFTYRNRNGELTDMAFGAFRFSGDITLNCFVGGRANGEANVKLSTGAAAFLLSDRKKVEASPNAGLAVSGNAFAGAEVGGAVGGKFSWVHPDEQFKDNAKWQNLFKISAGGTLALGVGAGFDFEVRTDRGRLVLVCKGRLVFGPGASGSFGSEIGADKIWDLVKTVFEVLSKADYHFIANIDKTLFIQWTQALYLEFTEDATDLIELLTSPAQRFDAIWSRRKDRKEAAESLAARIIAETKQCSALEDLSLNGLPYHQLPPETLGIMMSTLSESFIESWEEDQEKALLILVSQIRTWRQFFETLEHMSPDGEKVNPMDSLRTLLAILDDGSSDSQLSQFHRWIVSNLAIKPTKPSLNLAWTPVPIQEKAQRMTVRLATLRGPDRGAWA